MHKELQLKHYFISSDITTLKEKMSKYYPEYILYRDKTNPDYALNAKKFIEICSDFKESNAFLHQEYELAFKLNATGVHLTSTQFEDIKKAKELGLKVIVSTHTHEEVLEAEALGADYVTYSPIFASPGKGEPKGIEDLKSLLKKCNVKVFALGGIINEVEVEQIAKTKSYGFASIRYFD
ncbi:thiamine phosphate synthase [Sulfurimonas aquatica]|uniref:Thiamine phosphate synthase n=1 Tax=Sulfurimonas aquatica TaxID=2672570 RepID=A0A975AZS4_9BACT|nr:thiamine phosphate synthase [Sulfurimonas aquatica]QSZ41596.1 thiamine phosphate synthase [Sulfurimonas aquatica]